MNNNNNTPEYIPSLKDLTEIFVSLPKPQDWPHNIIKVQVAVEVKQHISVPLIGTGSSSIDKDISLGIKKTPCFITFYKYVENNGQSVVWLYEGKIRKEDYKEIKAVYKNLLTD